MEYVKRLADHVGARPDKFYKTTLFRGDALLLGLNCLEPGQAQAPHDHAGQDKFYYVVEGVGRFQVGEAFANAGPGEVVWAPAGVVHGVANDGQERLTLLVGIAPAP
jgi:quercetin dioxygenase-like cupin family protein